MGIALLTLAFVYLRFRFAHRTATDLWSRLARRFAAQGLTRILLAGRIAIAVPQVRRSFGFATNVRQAISIARSSFWMIVKSPPGFPAGSLSDVRGAGAARGIEDVGHSDASPDRVHPRRTRHGARRIFADCRVIVPLLIVYFASELVWQERDARLSENVDATPVSNWVLFLGKLSDWLWYSARSC